MLRPRMFEYRLQVVLISSATNAFMLPEDISLGITKWFVAGNHKSGDERGGVLRHQIRNVRTGRPGNVASCAQRASHCAWSDFLRTRSAQVAFFMSCFGPKSWPTYPLASVPLGYALFYRDPHLAVEVGRRQLDAVGIEDRLGKAESPSPALEVSYVTRARLELVGNLALRHPRVQPGAKEDHTDPSV